MSDARQQLHSIPPQQAREIERTIHDAMLDMVNRIGESRNISGFSVVLVGIRLWVQELCEIDRAAAGAFLRALADLFDPPAAKIAAKGRHAFLKSAETRRRDAVRYLHGRLRMLMQTNEGPPQ